MIALKNPAVGHVFRKYHPQHRFIRFFNLTSFKFSGHNKWSSIKHDKARNDMERSKVAFKTAQQITMAVKLGGSDPVGNPALSYALEKAKKLNVVKKVVENAIKRGMGQAGDKDNLETAVYEGIAPGGVSVIIEALTDNKSRTIGFVKPCFSKFNCQLTPTLYQFDKKGFITVDRGDKSFDEIFEDIVEIGCEDIEELPIDEEENPDGKFLEIITGPTETDVSIGYLPKKDMIVTLENEDQKATFEKFMRLVDDIDDVSNVYTNLKQD
ncbi:hypothetical protein PACTADRAFT_5099 [Pachysolen tannophilus NRRL Y-2460]|uniref:Transcriptional regulatory protein n=1 Tax=Pachysolen tannophilus NRRL Y-2460 TaxID=669874 RepID=A0A1E4TNM0_PACTA|nr:hypothetical protein PACTADRAFT_5099 [Pachysolen tannophilus NRRL Y-2460]